MKLKKSIVNEHNEEFYKNIIKTNPKHSKALNDLGELLSYQGKEEEAEKYFIMALELDPNNDNFIENLGNLFLSQGNFKKAEEFFLKQ